MPEASGVPRRRRAGRPADGAGALRLPDRVARALAEELPDLIRDVVDGISVEVPAYAEALHDGDYDVAGVATRTLHRLVSIADGSSEARRALTFEDLHPGFVALGQAEWRSGRSLDTLLAAYRVGARAAWRHVGRIGIRLGLSPPAMVRLAETVFAYVDELSAATARGYAEAQSASAAETQRRRTALAELLLRPGADPDALAAAAAAAGWRPPTTLAVAVVPTAGQARDPAELAGRIGPDVLLARTPETACLLVPDPAGPGRRVRLARVLRGHRAVVGLVRSWTDVGDSYPAASLAGTLAADGRLPPDDPLFVEDHLATLVLHDGPALLAELARRRLGPAERLPATTRERLLATLAAWLDQQGDRARTAAALHVHPQTVHYRMGQLRRLFGAALDDPDARFDLQLALRGRHPPGR